MKIETYLSPNCSEATMRIRATDLSANEIVKLIKDIEDLIDEKEGGETQVSSQTVFGIKCVVVSGDFPYNNANDLEGLCHKRKLEYEYDER